LIYAIIVHILYIVFMSIRKLIILPFLFLCTLSLSAQSLEDVVSPKKLSEQIIHHTNYTVSYNPDLRVPNWVSWSIEKDELATVVSRNGYTYSEDTDVKGTRVSPMDYSRSGYDRGHMCPAADNRFSSDAMRESFYMTNMCPQNHTLNEKTWNYLEMATRSWAHSGTIYIVCGPYFDKGNDIKTIGNNKVSVPDGFWKVLLREYKGNWQAIGFIMSNEDHSDTFYNYAVSVDEVEKLTGFDFFSSLDNKTEKEIESSFDKKMWPYSAKF